MNRSTVWVILLRMTLTLTLVMVSAGGPPAAGADRDASNRAAPATPPPAPVVTASRSGDAIVLTWAPTPGAVYYQVWRATEPYFTAPDPAHPERLLATVYPSGAGVETYTDSVSANLDNPFYHTFYIVVALTPRVSLPPAIWRPASSSLAPRRAPSRLWSRSRGVFCSTPAPPWPARRSRAAPRQP